MNQPIRILHVFSIMNRAGAETMIMNIYRNINRRKVQFDFIVHTQEKGDFDDEIESYGGKIYRVPKYKGINHFQYIKAWKNFFKDFGNRYSIIHSHIRSTASLFLPIAKENNLITVIHSHNTSSGSGLSSIVKKNYQSRLREIADYFFACSKEAGIWLFGDKVVEQKNFKIINNAIDSKKYKFNLTIRDKKRNELNLKDKFVIGHVGRFSEQKNHSYLIKLYNEYFKINPNSRLVLVGEGELREDILDKVKKYGLIENVLFLGIRSDINELLQAFDILVMPSLFEGLPVALIEAQAAGLPIIASNTITDEVAITDLITFKSIKEDPIEWAETIENKKISIRKNQYNEIFSAGYDVKNTAVAIQEFYISLSDK